MPEKLHEAENKIVLDKEVIRRDIENAFCNDPEIKGLFTEKDIDKNRFEQEIIYYIEKIDISEEKARLANHCSYFKEVMDEIEPSGKKLGFITQEIGREINTLGSKANDSDIQKIVVLMKDELEKIKEQVLNIL